MNTYRRLAAAAVLTMALTGCSNRIDARTDFPDPGPDVTAPSQPTPQFDPEPGCRPATPCPR